VNPDNATEEELQAIDKSPTPSSPECDRYTNRDQQAKDKADGPSSKTTAPRRGNTNGLRGDGQRQPSTEDQRAGAARLAERETAAAATAAGVVEQQPSVTTGLSERAQGKQPALPERQTTATQGGPSREHELLSASTSRPEANGTRTENNLPPPGTSTAQSVGPITFNEDNIAAVEASEITYRHNIASRTDYVAWRPSSMIFRMSLADIARELGVGDSGRLYFIFRGRSGFPDDFAIGDEARFASFMNEFVSIITYHYLSPEAWGQGLRYRLYISDAPIQL
jgi:hypothetical protein